MGEDGTVREGREGKRNTNTGGRMRRRGDEGAGWEGKGKAGKG